MDEQARVASFVDEHDLTCPPAYRLLDLSAEVGELAADATDSSGYGTDPDALSVNEDELGDTLFALLALCEGLDIEASAALDTALSKYERRLTDRGDAGSQ